MLFGIMVVFAVVIDAHETLNAREFFAKFPQCATHHAPILTRLPPNVLQFNTIRNNTSNDVCDKVLVDLNEMDDAAVSGCGDLCSLLDPETVKVNDKLYYATIGGNPGHTVYNKDADTKKMVPDLKDDQKFVIHTATVKSKNGAAVVVEWSGEAPAIGTHIDLSTTKGIVGQAKGAPWTIGFGQFGNGFEPVYVRDIKTHAWKWGTDRFGFFGGAGATDGKMKDDKDLTVNILATKLREIFTANKEHKANHVVKWGLGEGKAYLEAIFAIVGGPKCKNWDLRYGRPRGPEGEWNKKEGSFSAGCHTDMANLGEWQGSLAGGINNRGRSWLFPELPEGDWKLKDALKKYAWTNLWFGLNNHNSYPLATTPWQSGTDCASARTLVDGPMQKYCKLDWYGASAADEGGWKLGEVMVFDGHVSTVHEAMVLPGQTGKDHDKRVSVEFRARCECEVEGCGFANWDDTFPFTGVPGPFEQDEVVEHPELSEEEVAQDDDKDKSFDD